MKLDEITGPVPQYVEDLLESMGLNAHGTTKAGGGWQWCGDHLVKLTDHGVLIINGKALSRLGGPAPPLPNQALRVLTDDGRVLWERGQ